MENRSHALIAGLFTLLLACAAAAAFWWFGGNHEETNAYVVSTKRNVTGLSVQAQVRYRGIRVGKVEAIELDPQNPRVTLIRISVPKTIPLTRGTTAKLGFQGLTGIAHVLLEETGRDETPLPAGGSTLAAIPMQDSLFQELSDVGGDTLKSARDLLNSANELLNADNREAMARTLANLDATTKNVRDASAQLTTLLTPERLQLIDSTLARTGQAVGQAGPFFAEARGLVARLQAVSEKVDVALGDASASGGVAALVPRLNELSGELSANSRQIGRVLQMLEERPQSLIFGNRKSQTPGPGEAGFAVPAK